MINASIVLAGQLFGTAFACGLNLYATLGVLGIAARLGWVSDLPPGMRGLENGLVIGLAIALYLVEFFADRVRYLDQVWEGIHTLIRPATAALLTVLAMQDSPWYIRGAAALAAAAMALAAHGSKAGLRLILANRQARKPQVRYRQGYFRTLLSIAEDLGAIGLALAVILAPATAVIIVITSAALLVAGGPLLWRAAFLGCRAIVGRGRGFFGRRGWRSRSQISQSLSDVIPLEPLGRSPLRAAPAAITGFPRIGAYRNGWLVFTCDGPHFLYRSFFRARSVALPHATGVHIRNGLVTDVLDIEGKGAAGGGTHAFTIYLLKDGPLPQVAAAELTRSSPT